MTNHQETARKLMELRRAAASVAGYPGDVPATLADGYAIQDAIISQIGKPVRGWKIGLLPPDQREKHGAARLAGPAFEGAVKYASAGQAVSVEVFPDGPNVVEAEFVAVIGRDLAPRGSAHTEAEILDAVKSVHAGSEVCTTPLTALLGFGSPAVISEHGFNAAVIVGAEIENWRSLDGINAHVAGEGSQSDPGSIAKVPNGIGAALTFLVDNLVSRGLALKAGDVVATGALSAKPGFRPGQMARLVYDGYPVIEVELVQRPAR